MMKFILICASFLFVQVKSGRIHSSSKGGATYKAGVVEFNLRGLMTGQQKMDENTKRVIEIINSDETENVDILVFPESILNDNTAPIPLSKSIDGHSLCDMPGVHWVVREISCAAKKSATYVVINLITKDNAGTVYNTAMVFDRKGSIIAKYRKYHLFGERGVQSPPKPDVITFKTDFNATFGMFICFDLLFEVPGITLVNKGIKNFVYPLSWVSELPYLTAVQIQQGWAYANNVNLLAANANFLQTATFGSGIYTGRQGNSIAFIATKPTTKVLIADVPIDPTSIEQHHGGENTGESSVVTGTEYNLWKEDLSAFTIKFLNTSGPQSGEILSNGFHCKYEVSVTDLGEIENEKTYYYAVASINGHRTYATDGNIRTAQKICSIIACTKLNDRQSCGQMHGSSSKIHKRFRFDQLKLSTHLQSNDVKVIPNTLAMNLKPLEKINCTDSVNGSLHRVEMKLQEPRSDILTFSIYARDYQHDILNAQRNQLSHGNVYQRMRAHCCCCFQ